MPSEDSWRQRFEAFASRKVEEANAAPLSPYETVLEQAPGELTRVGNRWSMRLFDGPFYVSGSRDDKRPVCSLVFVQSADGNTGASDPATLGGGRTDKHLIYEGLSRVAADAVLAGAETVRGADLVFSVWHPELVALRHSLGLPRHPLQIIATRRGLPVADTLLLNIPEVPSVVLTVAAVAEAMNDELGERPWVRLIVTDRHEPFTSAFEQLRSIGAQRLSCVGGRNLARQLLEAELVDDMYLTTSPHRGGEPDTPLSTRPLGGRIVVRKRGTGSESGVVFEHRVLRPR